MNSSRARAVLLLALTFAAGAAAGVAGDRLQLFPDSARATERDGRDRRGDEGRPRQTTIERFADDLGLTAAQRVEIEEVLDEYRASAKALQTSVRPQYRALLDSARTRIESVLTGDQVIEYRALLEERARREGWERDSSERQEGRGARGDGAR